MRENGLMIYKTVRELKYGQTVQNMKVNTKMGRKVVKESLNSLMEADMKASFMITKSVDMEITFGKMEKHTKENGNSIK